VKKLLFISLLIFLISSSLFGGDRKGYEFLRFDIGARPSGMGGAFVSFLGDLNSIYHNPAGLATLNKRSFSFSYVDHLLDFKSGTVTYSQQLFKQGIAGFGVSFLDYGEFIGRDEFGNKTATFGAKDISITASYSYTLYENLFIGGAGKFFQSSIEDYSSNGYAIDLGAIYYIPKHELNIGVSLRNFGQVITEYIKTADELPVEIKGGLSKKLAHLPLIVSFELRKFIDEEIAYVGGGEFNFNKKLKLRFGYNSDGENQRFGTGVDRLAGISFGLGFLFKEFAIDYSFSSFGGLGNQNRFSISGQF